MIDFARIAALALAAADTLVTQWLPDGKRMGAEWSARNPTRGDGHAGSFSVNLGSGVWADFATGDKGGDLVSLYAYLHGMSQADAARAVADLVGAADALQSHGQRSNAAPAPALSQEKRRTPWQAMPQAPTDAPEPPVAHSVRGKPEARWAYRRGDALLGWVYRFRTSDGGKEVLPLVWAQNADTGAQEWRWLAMAVPRPLYLPGGALDAALPVLVVEGEKCSAYTVVSWPGGSKAWNKADWSWIAGRQVVIWPDADAQTDKAGALLPLDKQPGTMAAEGIAGELARQGCQVRIVKLPAPGELPGGWDVADAIAQGMSGDALLAFIRQQRAPGSAQSGIGSSRAQPASRGGDAPHAGWRRQLIEGKSGPRDCRENVIYILRDHPEWNGALAVDVFAKRIVCKTATPLGHRPGEEWTADDDSNLALWMVEQESLVVRSLDTIAQAVRHVALLRQTHPVREYFEGLHWDGLARCDRWVVDYMGCADTPYNRMVGLFFILNMVRRIYEPGCVMRSVPVFEGAQNKGKSRALWTLTNPWYSDTMLRIGDKDSYQLLQGIMCHEVSEMDSFSRAEATAVKAFISSTEDHFRAPYERSPVKHKRQTSFAATTNAVEYLKDWTGNTRFNPLAVGDRIDLDGLAAARDQLWAEAVVLYRQGERSYPTPEQERTLFKPEQDKRLVMHPWIEIVADYVAGMTRGVTVREIMQDALKIDMSRINPQGSEAQRVGQILHGLGFAKERETSGARQWVWRREIQMTTGDDDGVPF